MKPCRELAIAIAGAAALLCWAEARALSPSLLPPLIGATEAIASDPLSGLGASGYDVVSYHLDGRPRPGTSRFETSWGGVGWRFASEANLAAFQRDPVMFLPRTGGYDAYAAAAERIAAADPLIYHLQEGRLYLFRTEENRRRFAADPRSTAASETGWERIRGSLARN